MAKYIVLLEVEVDERLDANPAEWIWSDLVDAEAMCLYSIRTN